MLKFIGWRFGRAVLTVLAVLVAVFLDAGLMRWLRKRKSGDTAKNSAAGPAPLAISALMSVAGTVRGTWLRIQSKPGPTGGLARLERLMVSEPKSHLLLGWF